MADKKQLEKVVTGEFAATGQRDYGGFTAGLKLNGGIFDKLSEKQISEIMRDPRVKTAWAQRKSALVSRDWEVVPGDDRPQSQQAADELRDQLLALGWDRVCDKMLNGVLHGYSLAEIIWEIDAGRVVIANIKVRKSRKFAFNKSGVLLLKTAENPAGIPLPDRKFWHFTSGAEDDDTHAGVGLLEYLFWPVYFKKNGLSAWMDFLDEYARPTAVGKHPPLTPADDVEKLLEALVAMRESAAVAIPNTMAAEFLNAARTGTSDYKELVGFMNSEITQVIVGQTMTIEDGSSRSQSETHNEKMGEIVKGDADLLTDSSASQVFKWWTEYNYGDTAATPMVRRRLEEPEDIDKIADRDAKLLDLGWRRTAASIAEVYGDAYEPVALPAAETNPEQQNRDKIVPIKPAKQPIDLSALDGPPTTRDAVDDLVSRMLDDGQDQSIIDPLIQPVFDLLDSVKNLPISDSAKLVKLRTQMPELLTRMQSEQFVKSMSEAQFGAFIATFIDGPKRR
jgi:phage gp29-like protein